MRVLLDTNIFLDILLNRTTFLPDSENVIRSCEARGDEVFVAWHGLATIYYLLKRGRTEAKAMLELDKLLSWARVAACSDADARRARHLGFGDYEDALQAVSAEACGAIWLVTRNISDFSKSRVPAITPPGFLQIHPAP